MERQYFVYILSNQRRTVLYTGITNNLLRRVWEHHHGYGSKFARKYHCFRLVCYEIFRDPSNAIRREKQIKAGSRERKIRLIERMNPEWRDLYWDLTGSDRIASEPLGSSQ
jgi:putative endonuclease